jgi:Uncharacterized protein conserved in bacteria (DUF2140).
VKIKWSWKASFFTLLFLNILTLAGLMFIFYSSSEGDLLPDSSTSAGGETVLHVETEKADLNRFINYYIDKEFSSSAIRYEVRLTDRVELIGELPVFGHSVVLQMSFQPEALDNGDLLLREQSIRIGQLTLPVNYTLSLVKRTYRFPEWVEIFPNEESVYLHLTEIPFKNDLRVFARSFDLENDDIHFEIRLSE